MNKKSLCASIHDLRPSRLAECAELLELLVSYGFGRVGLALIPCDEDASSAQQEAFAQWCLSQAQHLWLLHGWKHRADPDLPRSLIGRFLQKICHQQAEFAGLDREHCTRILHHALDSVRSSGLDLAGFVAPTWHAPSFLAQLCREQGLELFESRLCISTSHARDWSFPLSFPSLEGDALWFRALDYAEKLAALPIPLRLVLHPEDLCGDQRRQRLELFLSNLSKLRKFKDYGRT